MDTEHNFHTGWNTARVTHYDVAPLSNQDYTAFKIRLVNLHYVEKIFMYMVPKDREVHEILKHLHHLGKGAKPWFCIKLRDSTMNGKRDLAIVGIRDADIPQEELEASSLHLRGGQHKTAFTI